MKPKNLNQKEFDFAQKIMNDLDHARRSEAEIPDELNKAEISKFIQETYRKQDIAISPEVVEQLIEKHTEGQKEMATLINKPLKSENLLKFKNELLEATIEAIRHKKFFTNSEFINALDYEKPQLPKLFFLGVGIVFIGSEVLFKSPFASLLISGAILGLGWFFHLENLTRWKHNQNYIHTFATNWRSRPHNYILDYQKISTDFEGRLLDEDVLRIESMRYTSAHISYSVFKRKEKLIPSFSPMDFLKDHPDIEVNFKHNATRSIFNEWQQKQVPIRLVDILILYKLEAQITQTEKTAQFLKDPP